MQTILSDTLQQYRRALIFEKAERAYSALRSDPAAWQEELKERAELEPASSDGLNESPYDFSAPEQVPVTVD